MKSDNFIITIVFFLALIGIKCNWNNGGSVHIPTNASTKDIILQDIQPQDVIGHFTGKDSNDTLRFQYFSGIVGTEITRIPSMGNDWDSIIDWFNQTHQIHSFIACEYDTLFKFRNFSCCPLAAPLLTPFCLLAGFLLKPC